VREGKKMRYHKEPSEPVVRDAHAIAHAIVRQGNQKIFTSRAKSDSSKAYLTKDVERLEVLIEERKAKFIENYGTKVAWTQYLDEFRELKSLEKILS
jgi:carboxypeptidase C (cathepsin A)